MPTTKPKYFSVTSNIQEIQKNYLIIHNAVFKFSFKKLFPLSILYGKQNFLRYSVILKKAKSELVTQKKFVNQQKKIKSSSSVRDYYIKLHTYMQQLDASFEILITICENLHNDQIKKQSINIKEQNTLIKKYQNSLHDYAQSGKELQILFNALKQSDD